MDTIANDDTLYFCLKIGKEKHVKELYKGSICFSLVDSFIKQGESTDNREQGDPFEGVFARIERNDERINIDKQRLGEDLEIIEDGKYVMLRRKSARSIPVFCAYGIYSDDIKIISRTEREDGYYDLKCRVDISSKMYSKFLSNKDDTWGFYSSSGHFCTALDYELESKNIAYRKARINYSLKREPTFYIEPTDDYRELDYKLPQYEYQSEFRYILYKSHRVDRLILKYAPISEHSANITPNELYMELTVIGEAKS